MESLVNPSDRILCTWAGQVLRDFPEDLNPARYLAKSPYYMFRVCGYVRTLSDD